MIGIAMRERSYKALRLVYLDDVPVTRFFDEERMPKSPDLFESNYLFEKIAVQNSRL